MVTRKFNRGMMKNLKTSTNIVLIALFLLLAFSRPSPADLVDPDPVRLLEAQLMTLDISGQLRPPADLTERIYNNLVAIRTAYPEVADITYRPRAVPDQIIVGLTQQSAEQFRNGEFHALDEMNELYGPVTMSPLRGSNRYPYIILQFDQIYNTQLLSEIYAEVEGLRYAEPNYYIGDGSTISADPPFYTFIRAWGDCPAGCIYRELYHFRVENGQVTIPDERYVDAINGDDDNYGLTPEKAFATIQAAINAAFNGDTVLVADGTYTGLGNRDIDFLGKAITVRSESGPENCIIDCNGTWEDRHRGFYFHNGEDANSILDGFTITNGNEWRGGGIFCENSSPMITNCIITDNIGSGIYCTYHSSPTITNCTITGNMGGRPPGGGGIYCYGSSPTITNCTISGNISEGISCEYFSSPTITNCSITGNTTIGSGGGVFCWYNSSPTITNCTISGNSAGYNGGGIYSRDSSPTITNCTISGNSALNGNALACDSYQHKHPSNLQLTNCILWDGGNEIWNNDGSTISINYSDVQGGYTGEGNIDADPCFVESGYWADANDPNIIVEPNDPNAIWVDGDYYLLPDSLCIDAGDPNYIPEPDETDIDGNPRVINGRIDMGAYEFWPPIKATMKLTPQMLNCNSKGKYIKAHLTLPEGFLPEDVDVNEAAMAEPMGIESEYIKVLGAGPVRLEICFDREAFCYLLTDDDSLEITVIGSLTTSQYFYATDTIKIKPRR